MTLAQTQKQWKEAYDAIGSPDWADKVYKLADTILNGLKKAVSQNDSQMYHVFSGEYHSLIEIVAGVRGCDLEARTAEFQKIVDANNQKVVRGLIDFAHNNPTEALIIRDNSVVGYSRSGGSA